MRILLAWMAFMGISWAAPQGNSCDANGKCPAPYECVKTRRGQATCEQICHPSQKNKQGGCPEDQRCVKDGDKHICRPIDDGAIN